jgi:hypothetical protein
MVSSSDIAAQEYASIGIGNREPRGPSSPRAACEYVRRRPPTPFRPDAERIPTTPITAFGSRVGCYPSGLCMTRRRPRSPRPRRGYGAVRGPRGTRWTGGRCPPAAFCLSFVGERAGDCGAVSVPRGSRGFQPRPARGLSRAASGTDPEARRRTSDVWGQIQRPPARLGRLIGKTHSWLGSSHG